MKLTKLQLENFRSHKSYLFEFPPNKKHTIILGGNGMGKTNLLEGIYTLSLGKSFRVQTRDDLVNWESDYMRCRGEISGEEGKTKLEVFYGKAPIKRKNFKKNDVNVKNSEYIGNLVTVLFYPEDLNMLYLSPSLRRKYLDTVLCQTDKKYLEALLGYKKVLKQRNALLQNMRKLCDASLETGNLDTWDKKMLEFADTIIKKREEFVIFLGENLENSYRAISGEKEEIKIKYTCGLEEPREEKLKEVREKDVYRGETTRGPHRDDLKFYINDKEINSSASRGEFRTLLLAVKIGEISYIKEKTGENPILLLDDVFSELDIKRRKHLSNAMGDCQTIITSTDIKGIEEIAETAEVICSSFRHLGQYS